MRHLSAKLSWTLLAVVILLFVSVALIADRITHALADSEQWVSHTHQVQNAIENMQNQILAADNSRLRFLLMPGSFAAPNYDALGQELKNSLVELQQLTRDNSAQQQRLAAVSPLIDEKISVLSKSISLQLSHAPAQAQDPISIESLQVTSTIAGLLSSMEQEENRLLQSREIVSNRTYTRVRAGLAIAFAIAILLLVLNFQQLAIELRQRKVAEDSVRRLSARLLTLQDVERRRVARELHDSIGQYFVSLKMNFDMLRMKISEQDREKILADCEELLNSGISETRTLSHLLHPPLLDEAGLVSAAKWFVEGFTQRSKILVTLAAPEALLRMPKDVELALFRVLQESLTNIHRHSGSPSAEISLNANGTSVNLVVKDFGKGISATLLDQFENTSTGTGVGLAGMRERIKDLGGTLQLQSDGPGGTTLTVSIPLPASQSADSASGPTPQAQGTDSSQHKTRPKDRSGDLLLLDAIAW